MIPLLTENARLLANAFRSMSSAGSDSETTVTQPGYDIRLSSEYRERHFHVCIRIEVRECRERYTMEMNDITGIMTTADKLVIQNDRMTWGILTADELPRPPGPVPTRWNYWDDCGTPRPCPRCL